MPLFFLSARPARSAPYPLRALPAWLAAVTRSGLIACAARGLQSPEHLADRERGAVPGAPGSPGVVA